MPTLQFSYIGRFFSFILSWWPTAIVLIAILWLTLAPDPVGDTHIELFPGADKLIHAIMMGGLASAAMFDYRRNRGRKPYRPLSAIPLIIIFICTAVFSGLDEIAQGAMHLGRSSDALDFLADIIGIIIAIFCARPVLNKIFP